MYNGSIHLHTRTILWGLTPPRPRFAKRKAASLHAYGLAHPGSPHLHDANEVWKKSVVPDLSDIPPTLPDSPAHAMPAAIVRTPASRTGWLHASGSIGRGSHMAQAAPG